MAIPINTTVNQIVKMFKDFSDSHMLLSDFGFGPTSDIGQTKQMEFPYLWMTNRAASSISIGTRTAIPTMTFTFIIVDQINIQADYKDENGLNSDNQQEILSDTFQTSQDLITYIQVSLGKYGIKLTEQDISIDAILDETTDKVSGWVFDLDIQVTHVNCTYPTDGIAPIIPTACPNAFVRNSNSTYTATVGSGGSLTLPDIEVEVNGVLFDTIPSVQDFSMFVKDTDGNETGSPIGGEWIVPPGGTPDIISYSRENWRQRPVNNVIYDLAWYRANTTMFDYIEEGVRVVLSHDDESKLVTQNAFGNFNRVTNDLGGNVYDGSDGSTPDYLVDNYTGLGWYLREAVGSSVSWVDSALALQTFTAEGFDDWRMPTSYDIRQIMTTDGSTSILNGKELFVKTIHWAMDSLTATVCTLWRSYQDYTGSTTIGGFNNSTGNVAITTIACRNHFNVNPPITLGLRVYYDRPALMNIPSLEQYDEGDLYATGYDPLFNIPTDAVYQKQDMTVDPDYLIYNNKFGHKFRFTGLNGGYYNFNDGLYYDVNGVLSTFLIEFGTPVGGTATTGYIIDHLTGMGWTSTRGGASTFSAALTLIASATFLSFSDWRVPTVNYFTTLVRFDLDWWLYTYRPPFINYNQSAHWTCTPTSAYPTTTAYRMLANGYGASLGAKSNAYNRTYSRLHYLRTEFVTQ